MSRRPVPTRKASWRDKLGPGLVTGAADDDPGGIGTYTQVGAQFGYGLGWAMILSYPLLAAIQLVCARIGTVTGRGIAANLKLRYPIAVLWFAVTLLLVANVVNIGADLGAMAAALDLVLPGSIGLYTMAFAVVSVGLEVFLSYAKYASVLKWATLSLLAYLMVPFAAGLDWGAVLAGLTNPGLTCDKASAMAVVALLGTTISPYLFFWQTGQEVEELHRTHQAALKDDPDHARAIWRGIRAETLSGMALTLLTALAIVVSAAATLHLHGTTQITSTAQAAAALRPIAGDLAFFLFATGLVGTGLLAVPVLAGSAAYAVSEAFGWREGLDCKPREAKAFYGVIALATLAGLAINLMAIDPMTALYWSAVLNGLLAPPLMALTLLLGRDRSIMGGMAISPSLQGLGWLATAMMTIAGAAFLLS